MLAKCARRGLAGATGWLTRLAKTLVAREGTCCKAGVPAIQKAILATEQLAGRFSSVGRAPDL
jgi:hypothetical protein